MTLQQEEKQRRQVEHTPHEVTPQPKPAAAAATTILTRAEADGTADDDAQLPVPISANSAAEGDLDTIGDDRNMITRHYVLGGVGGCCAALCVLALAFSAKGTGTSLQLLLELMGVVVGWCCILATGSSSKQKQQ
jgi:hypothetical protein